MEHIKAIQNLAELFRVPSLSRERKEFLEKILELKTDKDRIEWVVLGIDQNADLNNIDSLTIYGRVFLKNNFASMEDFEEYLSQYDIDIPSRGEGGLATDGHGYAISYQGILIEFATNYDSD